MGHIKHQNRFAYSTKGTKLKMQRKKQTKIISDHFMILESEKKKKKKKTSLIINPRQNC